MAASVCGKLHRLFVYGTLKRGQPNYNYMSSDSPGYCKFICDAVTTNAHPMVIATKWNLPLLINIPGVGKQVEGEVYEVDNTFLKWADHFEELYTREEFSVNLVPKEPPIGTDWKRNINGLGCMTCWVYFLTKYPEGLLELPFYSSYDSSGKHGRPYVSSNDESDATTFQDDLLDEVRVGNSTGK